MIYRYDLFCPTLKRKVHLQVSLPKDYRTSGLEYDSLYCLDGQNIFKDSYASFGRSMHLGYYLSIMGNKFNHRIILIAMDNAGSDLGRLNEYCPFKVRKNASEEWKKQDTRIFRAFEKDLLETIIPFIQKKFPVSHDPSRTSIFGSSLGGITSAYMMNSHPDVFGAAGEFSTASFICGNALYRYFDEGHINPNGKNFIYVGLKESSDGSFDETLYFNEAKKLHSYYKNHGLKSHLCVDVYGYHNEETWEKHILEFLSYLYDESWNITV